MDKIAAGHAPHHHHAKKQRRLIIGGILILSLGVVIIVFSRYLISSTPGTTSTSSAEERPAITTPQPTEVKVTSPLDGTLVTKEIADRRPLAVMIENHVDARPQAGLGLASIVYEAITEGGITRFMAIFGSKGGDTIGPVRSARPYFVSWALEYDAAYAHVGGSAQGLAAIKTTNAHDMDQFSIGTRAFRREPQPGLALEHTMYTDTAKLFAISIEKFGSDVKRATRIFKTPEAREHRPGSSAVSIDFSSQSFAVKWVYDPETNTYVRSMAGSLHKDKITTEAIRADNVIVQRVVRTSVENMQTVGSGKALVYQDGKQIEASWKKEKTNTVTVFTDVAGKEISLNPGVTWYEIVTPDTSVTMTQPEA